MKPSAKVWEKILKKKKWNDLLSWEKDFEREENRCYVETLLMNSTDESTLVSFLRFLLDTPNPTFFYLLYETLLANRPLYEKILRLLQWDSEEEAYHYLLKKAENHPDPEAKRNALSVMMILYDTF